MPKDLIDNIMENAEEELRKPHPPTHMFDVMVAGIGVLGALIGLGIAKLYLQIPWGETRLAGWFVGGFVFLIVYCLPSLIAHKRNHPQKPALMALNLVGGVTFICWVAALVWALIRLDKPLAPAGRYDDSEC